MGIKGKLGILVGLPIVGMFIILSLGMWYFTGITAALRDISLLTKAQSEMLEADRDIYQAFLAQQKAADTIDPIQLKALKTANDTNIGEAWDRIGRASTYFSKDMQDGFSKFKNACEIWKGDANNLFGLSDQIIEGDRQRQAASSKAITEFDGMRERIDQISGLLENRIEILGSSAETQAQRHALHKATELILNADRDAYQAYLAQLQVIAAVDKSTLDKAATDNVSNIGQVSDRIGKASVTFTEKENKLYEQFKTGYAEWKKQNETVISASKKIVDQLVARQTLLDGIPDKIPSFATKFETMRENINKLGELQNTLVEAEYAGVENAIKQAELVFSAITAAVVLLSLLTGILIAVSFSRAIMCFVDHLELYSEGNANTIEKWRAFIANNLMRRSDEFGAQAQAFTKLKEYYRGKVKIANAIADGDFTIDVPMAGSNDQFGTAFSAMVDSLNATFSQIQSSAVQVLGGAQQLSDASQLLSQGATEQASSMEEISSSMTDLGQRITQNAEHAMEANKLALAANQTADDGCRQMEDVVHAMDQITENATKVHKVIKVIDDIAFQTNLLALNAAVEAARAGRHGKGFAVVAEEVRNLAARSAKAARETADLIETSNHQVHAGAEAVSHTAKSLQGISDQSRKVCSLVGEIANASSEQAEGVKQVNIGLAQIETVTQQNTASAEETASSSQEMASMATLLQQLISQYRLRDPQAIPEHQFADVSDYALESSQHHQLPYGS